MLFDTLRCFALTTELAGTSLKTEQKTRMLQVMNPKSRNYPRKQR